MPFTVAQMLSWDYEKMMNKYGEFMENITNSHGQAILNDLRSYLHVISQRKCVRVHDYTNDVEKGKAKVNHIIQTSKESTLILVDGESGSGKSTFAAQLCEKEGFFLFDIDEYAMSLLMEHILSGKGGIIDFDRMQNTLLRKHTEEIIKNGSEHGKKTTVMVGCFRNVIFRTIIAQTIGKYFRQVKSIVIHDELEANLARIKERNGGVEMSDATAQAQNTYLDMEELKQIIPFYGIGCDESCWVNHAAVHDF